MGNPSTRAAALSVARRLAAAGHRALFAGGCVRDRLLGIPAGDYDVATSATPEAVESLFAHAVTVGARFGVVVVPVEADGGAGAGGQVEVATFRADGRYVDGRRPEGVVFSDPPTDAARRDFTVNGLFEEPETGEVLDYVGGRADLSARLLRAIGDPEARFREDHLRLLRAVRFAVRLGFGIEPKTLRAVRTLAPLVADVSPERTRDEVVKILDAGRGRALRLLSRTGLLDVVLPEIAATRGVPQPPAFHPEGDVFVHTCLVLDQVNLDGLDADGREDVLLGALLHDVGKPPTKTVDPTGRIRFNGHDALGADLGAAICERLRFPRRRIDQVASLVATHMTFPNLPKMRRHRLREFLGAPDLALHLALHRADCGGSHGDLSLARFCEESLATFRAEPVLPPPIVRGEDLLRAGYAPGRRLGALLRWLREEHLEGRVTTCDEAVRRVLTAYPPGSAEVPPS
jgi:poly(A) polymerase